MTNREKVRKMSAKTAAARKKAAEKAKTKESLNEEYKKLLEQASKSVKSDVSLISAKIIDIYELGYDNRADTTPDKSQPKLWTPIQPIVVEIEIPDEDDNTKTHPVSRQYVIRGAHSIKHLFGKVQDGKFSKLTYNDEDIPIGINVPDMVPNEKGVVWYELGEKKAS